MSKAPICTNCVHLRNADARHPLCAHPEARRSLVDGSLMQAAASERAEKVTPSYCGPEGNGHIAKYTATKEETGTTSVRLLVHGLVIDAQCGKGSVVNLIVRADQQHKGFVRGFLQHLTNAFFSAGDFCNPGNHNRALRVVRRHVSATAVNDDSTNGAHAHAVEIYPLHSANGDAHYMAALVHEGVERHHDGRAIASNLLERFVTVYGRKKCADDSQVVAPQGLSVATVLQDQGGTQ